MMKQSAQAAELAAIRDRLFKENKDLEVTNKRLNYMRLNMYESLMIERSELESRIRKIDLRIISLGLEVPDFPRWA